MTVVEKVWYGRAGWLLLLWPISLLFQLLTAIRRAMHKRRARKNPKNIPVIVVGNITVGGTGKTPLLITLAQHLKAQGRKPGIISRGYGATTTSFPHKVSAESSATECGDEAVVIAQQTGCPVVIDPCRNDALNHLLQNHKVDVVLSDDGLQHYKLYRDMEIIVVDGQRLFGNGMCLPVGPLRENLGRLKKVDFVVVNGEPGTAHPALADAFVMDVQPRYLVNQLSGDKQPFGGAPFHMGSEVKAIAGIGNPERFFKLLQQLPYPVETFAFPDHHPFTADDFARLDIDVQQPVVMTEKDAVKCQAFAGPNFWTLSIKVNLPDEFLRGFDQKLDAITKAG